MSFLTTRWTGDSALATGLLFTFPLLALIEASGLSIRCKSAVVKAEVLLKELGKVCKLGSGRARAAVGACCRARVPLGAVEVASGATRGASAALTSMLLRCTIGSTGAGAGKAPGKAASPLPVWATTGESGVGDGGLAWRCTGRAVLLADSIAGLTKDGKAGAVRDCVRLTTSPSKGCTFTSGMVGEGASCATRCTSKGLLPSSGTPLGAAIVSASARWSATGAAGTAGVGDAIACLCSGRGVALALLSETLPCAAVVVEDSSGVVGAVLRTRCTAIKLLNCAVAPIEPEGSSNRWACTRGSELEGKELAGIRSGAARRCTEGRPGSPPTGVSRQVGATADELVSAVALSARGAASPSIR